MTGLTPEPDGPSADLARARLGRRILTGGRSLREHTARGTLINGLFQVSIASLTFARGFIVAAFLSPSDYGIWGILVVGLGALMWLKGSGVSDKYVQQASEDDERAFQTAFTMELLLTSLLALLMVAALPVLALVYGQWRIIAPGLVVALVLVPLTALQTPQWVFYRSMDFVRQRVLQAADPVMGFVFTIILAVAGFGYWSLVLGQLCGSLAGGFITLRAAPYPLALRLERSALVDYFAFSWPVAIAGGSAVVIAQGSLLIVNASLGLAAVGTLSLASQISGYADGIDAIVTGTLYPAICAVQDRVELLFESFVKSNRLALMWGVPFGIGMVIFAPQLVRFVIGEHWRPAIGLIQIFGVSAAAHQVGFNWMAFYSARGNTRPLATGNVVLMVTFLVSAIPLTILDGLSGMGIALLIMVMVGLATRAFYLRRLFANFRMTRHLLRAVAPTVPSAAATMAMRLATGAPASLGGALGELCVYLVVTVAATCYFEHDLLREVLGYVKRSSSAVGSSAVPEAT
jgi:O-antigen/teichoic acid export membrane protein